MGLADILKVTMVEGRNEADAASLGHLEQLAPRLMEVEKLIDDCRGKLSSAEKDLADFRERSELERRFSELAGLPYEDKSSELEERVKSLKGQLESLSSEKVKLRSEILSGLAGVILPVEADGCLEASGEGVYFKFREGAKYPAITSFIKSELGFGLPPVYVTMTPEGLKVVGVNDKASALKEVVKTVECLRAKASSELGNYTYAGLNEKAEAEEPHRKGAFSPFKRLHMARDHK